MRDCFELAGNVMVSTGSVSANTNADDFLSGSIQREPSREKSFELRLRAMRAVIPLPELVIAEGSVDHFQPQNRLAFAFGSEGRRIETGLLAKR
jgi:hypothetical protein